MLGGGQGTVAQKVLDVAQVGVVPHEREPVLEGGCCSAHKRLSKRIIGLTHSVKSRALAADISNG